MTTTQTIHCNVDTLSAILQPLYVQHSSTSISNIVSMNDKLTGKFVTVTVQCNTVTSLHWNKKQKKIEIKNSNRGFRVNVVVKHH